MSRIGKQVVTIPDKVEVKISATRIDIKGPKGQLHYDIVPGLLITKEDKHIVVKVDSKGSSALWGMARALINNMVIGVTTGFTRNLEFTGVGYKAAAQGNKITLNLGYSHPIEYELPTGIAAKVAQNKIELTGCDKELLGFVAAKIRGFRPPEPYKGKGIKYAEEHITRKAGKTGAAKTA